MMKKAFEICMEMLVQRGCKILDYNEEIILAEKNNGTDPETKKENERLCVFLSDTAKLNVDAIHEIMSRMHELKLNHSILVYNTPATSQCHKIIAENPDIKIEIFLLDELQYNITKHELVPVHQLAFKKGTEAYEEFKKKYLADKFPIILSSDPVAKFFNFGKGDIIRIFRKNGIISYRIVR